MLFCKLCKVVEHRIASTPAIMRRLCTAEVRGIGNLWVLLENLAVGPIAAVGVEVAVGPVAAVGAEAAAGVELAVKAEVAVGPVAAAGTEAAAGVELDKTPLINSRMWR